MSVPVKEYFDVKYGVNLELVSLIKDPNGINFVSRTSKNNGVSAKVRKIQGKEPNPPNTISVACGGSVMESFLQKKEYYSGRDIYILIPKLKLTEEQLLFYCLCLRSNKYRYNYGRQANKTLRNIKIPSIDEIPAWVKKIFKEKEPSKNPILNEKIKLDLNTWKTFKYEDIFDIKKGFYNKKPPSKDNGTIPFIGATDKNNGITSRHELETVYNHDRNGKKKYEQQDKIFSECCITISNNGSVGYAFFQDKKFTCSHDVNPVYLKNRKMNVFIAMFLCTLISLERYRWNYGRKWRPARMPSSEILLPVDSKGDPDWNFMEKYIKTIPFSSNLKKNAD